MDPLTAFYIYLFLFIAAELLRPKPELEDARAATFEEFQIPTTDPKRPISVIWGRTRIRSAGIVWYGDYRTDPIVEHVKTGLFSKTHVITGYHYSIGIQLGVAREVESYEAFDWDDERLVTFSPEIVPPDAGTLVAVDDPNFLGGPEGAGAGGGVVGNFRFFKGGLTQEVSGYLSLFQTPITPAYRHLAYVLYEGVTVGTQPRIAPPAFVVKRFPNQLGLTGGMRKVGQGANPAAVIYELMTNNDFGLTIDAADINAANFRKIGGRLFREGHSYSNNWTRRSEVKTVIDDILRQIDATMFLEYTTGQFEMRLVRDPGSESPVTVPIVLNESNIVELESFRRLNWSETTNRVVVNWKDASLAQTPSPAVQDDMANQRIQGRNAVATFSHPGIDNAQLAAEVAARELRAGSFPVAVVSLTANRDAINLRPGDVFELQWDELGIATMIMRVLAIAIGSSTELRVRVDCSQDVYSLGQTIYQAPGQSLWFNPATVEALPTLADDVFEAPLFLDRFTPLISPQTSASKVHSRIVMLPVAAQQNTVGWRMFEGRPGSPAIADVFAGDWSQMCPSGFMVNAIALNDFIDPMSPGTLLVSTPTNFRALADATAAEIVDELANLFRINDEFFSFETVVLNADGTLTLGGIHRAKLDSLPVIHATSPRPRIFFMGVGPTSAIKDAPRTAAGGITDDSFGNGTSGSVMALPKTTRGILDEADGTVRQFTSTARIARPYPPKNLEIEVPAVSSESPQILNSPAFPAAFFSNRLNLPRGDWIFTWDNRNRGELIDEDYDAVTAQALEANTEVVFEFRSTTLSPLLRRTITSTAETITYLTSEQDADFGGPGSPGVSPAVQEITVEIYTRRTDSPALESEQRYTFTIQRTV